MRVSNLRAVVVGVAVVLAAAAPAHAITNVDADRDGHPCEKPARAEMLPAKHELNRDDSGNSLSKRYYGSRGGALTILFSIGLKKWTARATIVRSNRYKAGDTIVIPKPPIASINAPSGSSAHGAEGNRPR